MRPVSWIFLILSFSLGIGCALIVRHYMFEAKPVQVAEQGPTAKILVATKAIPRGEEITAEAVAFIEVPADEIPAEAITSFAKIGHRRAALPIPVGCPICDDLLLPDVQDNTKTEKFIPPGSQVVSLELKQVDFTSAAVEKPIPITDYFTADQGIDIRILPKEKLQSELVERKNQLLKTFLPKEELVEKGEILLENVKIHQIQTKPAYDGKQVQTLTLLLVNTDAEKLATATRKHRIRVVRHQTEPQNVIPAELAVAPEPALPEPALPEPALPEPAQPEPPVTAIAKPAAEPISVKSSMLFFDPAAAEITDSVLEPMTLELAASVELPSAESVQSNAKLTFVPITIHNVDSGEIHNDKFSDNFSDNLAETVAPMPKFLEESVAVSETKTNSLTTVRPSRSAFKVLEIGLPVMNLPASSENATDLSVGYSPWGRRAAAINSESSAHENDESDGVVQPLPLRSRKKVSQL